MGIRQENGFVFISDLVVKLLTTMTLATMAQVITGQGLVGDWVDPTGSAPIIAGLQTLVGPREAVTGAPQAHLVRAHPQVNHRSMAIRFNILLIFL